MSCSLGYLILERDPCNGLPFCYVGDFKLYTVVSGSKAGPGHTARSVVRTAELHGKRDALCARRPAKYLYILLKGNAVITYKPYDGPAITLTRLQPGDVFGWSAVVGSAQYTSGSISVSHVEVARVLASDLWQFVRDHPETGEFLFNRIASSVSTRWKDAHVQVQAMLDKGRST